MARGARVRVAVAARAVAAVGSGCGCGRWLRLWLWRWFRLRRWLWFRRRQRRARRLRLRLGGRTGRRDGVRVLGGLRWYLGQLRRRRFGLKQLADSLHDGENLLEDGGDRDDPTAELTDGVSAFLDFGFCLPSLVARVPEGARRCPSADTELHQHAAQPRRPLCQRFPLGRGAPQQPGGWCALFLDEFPGYWEAGEDEGDPVPRAPEEGTRLRDPGTDGLEPQRRLLRFLKQSEQVAFAHRRKG